MIYLSIHPLMDIVLLRPCSSHEFCCCDKCAHVFFWVSAFNYLGYIHRSIATWSCSNFRGFSEGSDGKEFACSAGKPGLIPRSRRSLGEGNGNPLQYSCLENPIDRGAWWATVHRDVNSMLNLWETEKLFSTMIILHSHYFFFNFILFLNFT